MSTVAKTNMCGKEYKGLLSYCSAQKLENQENCTHYIKHTFLKQCMFYREDLNGACDNWWAQIKQEMPEHILKFLRGER